MRGEHALICHGYSTNGGSSPHARGALLEKLQHSVDGGIIPACAGSTVLRAAKLR